MPEVRLIDGNRLAELFETAAERGAGVLATVYRDAAHFARTAPTISPEVRHGRWIFVGEETMHDGWTYRKHKCSECGFSTVATNFCPNCGARMDGGDSLVLDQ